MTKNEGLLFALLLGLLFCISGSGRLKAAVLYLLAFAGCSAFWFWWSRLHLDLAVTSAASGLHHLDADSLRRAAGRIVPAGKAICSIWRDIRQWNLVGFAAGIASFAAVVQRKQDIRLLFLPIALLAGYLATILLNSNEIYWQIGTEWNRLTVHSLPLLLMVLTPIFWKRPCYD